jgi:hypothetical protein
MLPNPPRLIGLNQIASPLRNNPHILPTIINNQKALDSFGLFVRPTLLLYPAKDALGTEGTWEGFVGF